MIRFETMSEGAFERFLAEVVDEYAAEHVRGGRWTAEEAPEAARATYAELLPQGVNTPDHYLRVIVDAGSGDRVGVIWYWHERQRERVFLYDIVIDAEKRRQGFAEQALLRLEEETRKLGASQVLLHVFGHNMAARRLYEKMGFEVTNVNMRKWV